MEYVKNKQNVKKIKFLLMNSVIILVLLEHIYKVTLVKEYVLLEVIT